jgi:hypothetical protein
MSKRLFSVLVAGALIASVFSALPAQAATEVPAVANIEDPAGDANGHSFATGTGGGLSFRAADILKVWFTNDADTISTHIQTNGSVQLESLTYVVYVDPGVGDDCMQIRGTSGGNFNDPFASLNLSGDCGSGTEVAGEFIQEEGPDETGIHTIKLPRSLNEAFQDGKVLATPNALVGQNAQAVSPRVGIIDDTDVGTDYTISGGGSAEPPATEEPPAEEPEEKPKKNCKKKKGKAKKKCKKAAGEAPGGEAPGQACPAYVPGEQGAEAESVVVTDEHTEEAPLELTIEQEVGLANDLGLGQYDGTAHTFRNLQLDSAAAEAGLYIRYEFPAYEDHDLYVNYADGSEAAHVGGFNATPVGPFDGTGAGGHSETGAEQIDGLRTADCAGYTIDFSNYLGEGGEYTVIVWLGETLNDPAPPGEGKRISQF